MKYALLSLVLLCAACKKDGEKPASTSPLVGEWERVYSIPFATGDTIFVGGGVYRFYGDYRVTLGNQSAVTWQGTWEYSPPTITLNSSGHISTLTVRGLSATTLTFDNTTARYYYRRL